MLDVEFFNLSQKVDAPIIYVYRSGALRRRFRQAVVRLAARLDVMFDMYAPEQIVTAAPPGGLFGSAYRYCDWPTRGSRMAKSTVDTVAHVLASGEAKWIALLLPDSCQLCGHPEWSTIEKCCLVIEEARIKPKTLTSYLHYFDETTDLAPPGSFLRQTSFRRHFADVAAGGELSVAELMHRFDEVVLLCSDDSNVVRPPEGTEGGDGTRAPALLPVLRALVLEQDSARLLTLSQIMAERRQRGFSCVRRHVELLQKGVALLGRPSERAHSTGFPPDHWRGLLWCGVLLGWDERLAGSSSRGRWTPEMFSVTLDQMARDYLKRCDFDQLDPLLGLWPNIRNAMRQTIKDEGYGRLRARRRLVNAISRDHHDGRAAWGRRWANRLGELTSETVMMIENLARQNEERAG